MCGRFSMHSTLSTWTQLYFSNWDSKDTHDSACPRYNIAPTHDAQVILGDAITGLVNIHEMRWGIPLTGLNGSGRKADVINARSESILTKPKFRDAFQYRRCLIPVSGFFEWQAVEGRKQPYYFTYRSEGIFAFAGIWETSKDRAADGTQNSFCILTTNANSALSDMHDRMPVILEPSDYSLWINPDVSDDGQLTHLLKPLADDMLQRWPVSTAINRPGLDTPDCIQEIPERLVLKETQLRLF